jgi:hypothetical protein
VRGGAGRRRGIEVTCHSTAPSLDNTSEVTVYKFEGINIIHITVQIVMVLE